MTLLLLLTGCRWTFVLADTDTDTGPGTETGIITDTGPLDPLPPLPALPVDLGIEIIGGPYLAPVGNFAGGETRVMVGGPDSSEVGIYDLTPSLVTTWSLPATPSIDSPDIRPVGVGDFTAMGFGERVLAHVTSGSLMEGRVVLFGSQGEATFIEPPPISHTDAYRAEGAAILGQGFVVSDAATSDVTEDSYLHYYTDDAAAPEGSWSFSHDETGDHGGFLLPVDLDGDGADEILVGTGGDVGSGTCLPEDYTCEHAMIYALELPNAASGQVGTPLEQDRMLFRVWTDGEVIPGNYTTATAAVADFDRDGNLDLAVGAPFDGNGDGAVYLLSDFANRIPMDKQLEREDFDAIWMTSESVTYLGTSLVVLDGFFAAGEPALAIGAPGEFHSGATPEETPGAVYVVPGRELFAQTETDVQDHQPRWLELERRNGDVFPSRIGRTLTNLGDIDGDGIDDLGIGTGANGTHHVYLWGSTIDLSAF